MKTILFFFCQSLLICTFQLTIAQSTSEIHCNSLEKPYFLKKDQNISIQCDSAVLINFNRYRLYEKAREAVINSNSDKYNQLFSSFEIQSGLYNQWKDSLQLKYNELSFMFNKSMEMTKNNLQSINGNLNEAKESLVSANKNLSDALIHLKASKREKWLFATIGILVGSISTYLLVGR